MDAIRVGDIVGRKSYGGDIAFKVAGIEGRGDGSNVCTLRGVLYRIHADAEIDDLVRKDTRETYAVLRREVEKARSSIAREAVMTRGPAIFRAWRKPGRILHIDSSAEFIQMCVKHYNQAGIMPITKRVDEADQPKVVKRLLQQYRPDMLVLTGHDSYKKGSVNLNSLDNYRNSRYFIDSVKIAREYESNEDKLFVYAGACQSYYEGIMGAGANFASSPGRILIHALDPAIVSQKVALTEQKRVLTPDEVVSLTMSGREGVGGKNTKGHLVIL